MRVQPRTCPTCGEQLDGAHSVEGQPCAPKLGDLTVCIYCATPLRFAAGDVFEALTDEQLGALSVDELAGIEAGQQIAARPMPKARA